MPTLNTRALGAAVVFLGLVVAANVLTSTYGLVPAGFGLTATAGTWAAGLVLLARDLVDDANRGAGWGDQTGRPLSEVIALLPTPRASDAVKGGPNQRGSAGDLALPAAVQAGRFGGYEAAVRRQEAAFGLAAPDPTEPGRTGRPRLTAGFAEWMLGLPRGWITEHVGRTDAIRIAGNGVVWQQATYALSRLPTMRAAVEALSAEAVAA